MMKETEIPEGVNVEIKEKEVKVSGQKGEITKDFNDPRFNKLVTIEKDGNKFVVKSSSEKRKIKAFVGTINSIVKNLILGVSIGFKFTMKVFYAHFPMNITVKDNEVHIKNFLGEKGARIAKIIGNTQVKVEKDTVVLTGIEIEKIGQTASNIEQACKLSKRDRRIFNDGIYISGRFLQTGEAL